MGQQHEPPEGRAPGVEARRFLKHALHFTLLGFVLCWGSDKGSDPLAYLTASIPNELLSRMSMPSHLLLEPEPVRLLVLPFFSMVLVVGSRVIPAILASNPWQTFHISRHKRQLMCAQCRKSWGKSKSEPSTLKTKIQSNPSIPSFAHFFLTKRPWTLSLVDGKGVRIAPANDLLQLLNDQ